MTKNTYIKNKNSLAIVVNSYDGYSDLWGTFFKIFYNFWGNCEYKIYLINNEKDFICNNVNVINTGPEINWFYRTIKAIEDIDEKYILFFLEDYYISKNIMNSDVNDIINFMELNDVFYYRLSKRLDISTNENYVKISTNMKYPISLQPAIWNREYFLGILYEISGVSPWDFEYYFLNKYANSDIDIIKGAYYDSRDILGYKNGVLRGKWIPDTLKFYEKLGMKIDIGDREVLSIIKVMKYKIALKCSNNLSSNTKNVIKKMLKKFRFDYLR